MEPVMGSVIFKRHYRLNVATNLKLVNTIKLIMFNAQLHHRLGEVRLDKKRQKHAFSLNSSPLRGAKLIF